jgi:hypothetical protein
MEGRPEASKRLLSAEGSRGQPAYPMLGLGNRKARTGRPATRHLPQPGCVLHCEHGKRPRKAKARGKEGRETPTKRRCPWQWRTGRRSPQTGKPATRGGRGVKAPPTAKAPRCRKRRMHREPSNRRRPVDVGEMQKKLRQWATEAPTKRFGDL